jgi:hypothetical protein
MRRLATLATLGALAIALWTALGTGVVRAHGGEVEIEVTPLRPDPGRPLLRLYHVVVTFQNDGEPVDGASVELSAVRQQRGDTVGPLELTEIEGRPGTYAGEIEYARFGSWDVTLRVAAALGQGEGEVSFTDEVRPRDLTVLEEEALQQEAERVFRLQTFFGLDWWPDVVNVLARITHSLAGLSYFGATSLALLAAWIGPASVAPAHLHALRRWFRPVAGASLAALLAAGVYGTVFDAPVLPPGLFDMDAMLRLPYGEWYLAAFAVKPVLFVVLVIAAVRIDRGLRRVAHSLGKGDEPNSEAAGHARALRRATALNAGAGLLLVIDVAVVIYLHYVSHLGVFLPE